MGNCEAVESPVPKLCLQIKNHTHLKANNRVVAIQGLRATQGGTHCNKETNKNGMEGDVHCFCKEGISGPRLVY
ncbi:hypothetical protein H5410_019256 [Solanum commersonii]|uniref:Uncharacterized protein n=1 Tax=Solanum commersonii TaxID=4109 RepID=A0A9J6A4X8_SOLCO|nr:hypothetical protein H5410_019256 [Solanum commersonii]